MEVRFGVEGGGDGEEEEKRVDERMIEIRRCWKRGSLNGLLARKRSEERGKGAYAKSIPPAPKMTGLDIVSMV